jgi:hypothetical protein
MTVTTDALLPALEDAREAHAAVIDRFRSDMTVTPAGPYRQVLERHVTDTQDQIDRIEHHVREIRPSRPLRDTVETVRSLARGAVRTTRLPLEIGALIATGMLRGRYPASERRLLKNAEDEYAMTARALAASRAGESIAEQANDQAASDLLGALRRRDEELLETLQNSLTEHAQAVVAAAHVGRTAPDGGGLPSAATRTLLTAFDRVRDAARTATQQTVRTTEGAARQMPRATRMAEELQGAVTRAEDLPISGYDQLRVTEITQQLPNLSQTDLTVIDGYERAHANRPGVLNAIERLRGNEPWPGYDAMSPDQISARLQTTEPALARQVRDYEQRHQQRETIINAAEARTTS